MNHHIRFLSSAFTIVLAAALAAPAFVDAQTQSPTPKPSTNATPSGKPSAGKQPWTLGYTPDGRPDLQGYWTSITFTPMERPTKYGNREFLTDAEMQENYKAGLQHSIEFTFNNSAETPVYDATVYGLAAAQNGVRPNKRSSIVVDPPDGRIPPLTSQAKAKLAEMKRLGKDADSRDLALHADGPEDLTLGLRCLNFAGPPIGPGGYDSTYHIVQSPGYVLIEYEWNSEARIIPIDGGSHASSNFHGWHGDSRGHWEGNTLVVETVNFRPGATYQNAVAKSLKITERFSRINAETIEYKFTIDDPSTWTKPWSGIVPLTPAEGPMFEYACSEGNNGLVNILAGVRAEEKTGVRERAGAEDRVRAVEKGTAAKDDSEGPISQKE